MSTSDWQMVEQWAAAWFREHGWPSCERRGRGFAGRELIGMPGLAAEIKSRRKLRMSEWIAQAMRNPDGGLPFVISKPDGMGQARFAHFPMIMPVWMGTGLLLESGYGGNGPDATMADYPDLLALYRRAALNGH